MALEMQLTESGPKPIKLGGDGKKKQSFVTIATASMVLEDQVYKVQVKVTGPDKDGAEELFGTSKLGETIEAEFTPESPE
jgi:hypothetical protein